MYSGVNIFPFSSWSKTSIGLIYGGLNASGGYVTDISKINFSSEVFTSLPLTIPEPVKHPVSTQSSKYSFFVGGQNASGYRNIVQKIDLFSLTASSGSNFLKSLAQGVSGSSMTDGYYLGGRSISGGNGDTYIVKGSFSTETYANITNTLRAQSYASGNMQNKTSIYVAFNDSTSNAQKLTISNETVSNWSVVLSGGFYCWNAGGTTTGGYLTSGVYNGYFFGTDIYYSNMKVNFSTDTQTFLSSNLGRRYSASVFNKGSIYIYGGMNNSSVRLTNILKFSETTETSSVFGDFSYTAKTEGIGSSANTIYS